MAAIDVTELMSDPDFTADTLFLIGTGQTVGTNGRAPEIDLPDVPLVGVVSPTRAKDLLRLPEGVIVNGSITVITQTDLSPGSNRNGRPADKIRWRGDIYVVSVVDDFQEFGQGFTVAVCTLLPLATA